MVVLPHNVLSEIAAKADPRTQVRLRATSKALYSDPLAATKPLREGYTYGTGKLQKEYNELPKKLRRISASIPTRVPKRARESSQYVRDVEGFVADVVKAYKLAVRRNQPTLTLHTYRGFTFTPVIERVLGREFHPKLGVSPFRTLTGPREELVTATLTFAKAELPNLTAAVEAMGGRISPAVHWERRYWPDQPLDEEREYRRAERIARRAARRMQEQ